LEPSRAERARTYGRLERAACPGRLTRSPRAAPGMRQEPYPAHVESVSPRWFSPSKRSTTSIEKVPAIVAQDPSLWQCPGESPSLGHAQLRPAALTDLLDAHHSAPLRGQHRSYGRTVRLPDARHSLDRP
jgi:hypothetical protein